MQLPARAVAGAPDCTLCFGQVRRDLLATGIEPGPLGRGANPPRAPVEQPYLELTLQAGQRSAYRGGGYPECAGGPAEGSVLDDFQEHEDAV